MLIDDLYRINTGHWREWFALALAREADGDTEGAEVALEAAILAEEFGPVLQAR